MPSIGPMEIVAVAAIALIVFGPEKLPEIARTVGRTLSQLRRMADEVRDEFKDGLDFDADDDDDAPGPAPRRDHPNVRAVEAASAAKPAWEAAPGDDGEQQEEDFDPNYDVVADGNQVAEDAGEAPAGPATGVESEQIPGAKPAGTEGPSTSESGTATGGREANPAEVDGPPEQRAG